MLEGFLIRRVLFLHATCAGARTEYWKNGQSRVKILLVNCVGEARGSNVRYWREKNYQHSERSQMSLHPEAIVLIPEETARVAHAVFPREIVTCVCVMKRG